MKKLWIILLMLPVLVFAEATHFTDLTVDDDLIVIDDTTLTDDVTIGGTLAITGGVTFTGVLSIPDGTAAAPSLTNTGDTNTGLWFSAADVLNITNGGVEQLEIDATSLDIVPDTNITGGIDVDGDTDLDDVTISGVTDLAVGAVGAPALFFTGSATTGLYQTAADEVGVAVGGANVGTWDGTGLVADGFNGPLGTTTPAAVTATTIDGSTGTFSDVLDVADGLEATPEIVNTGDLDTGIWFSAADTMNISVGGGEVTEWDSTGIIATGINGPLGTVTPNTVECTTLDGTTGTFTDVVDIAAGAEATPELVPTGDLDTGIWFSAADTINLSTAGAEIAEFDATAATFTAEVNAADLVSTDDITCGDDLAVTGVASFTVGTFADGDVTPDVSGATIWESQSNTGATAITDLDNPVVGAIYTIICADANNPPSIADGGNFALSANWTSGLDDTITLYVQADNDYIEVSRSDN